MQSLDRRSFVIGTLSGFFLVGSGFLALQAYQRHANYRQMSTFLDRVEEIFGKELPEREKQPILDELNTILN